MTQNWILQRMQLMKLEKWEMMKKGWCKNGETSNVAVTLRCKLQKEKDDEKMMISLMVFIDGIHDVLAWVYACMLCMSVRLYVRSWRFTSKCSCLWSGPDGPGGPDKSSYRFFAGTRHFGTTMIFRYGLVLSNLWLIHVVYALCFMKIL